MQKAERKLSAARFELAEEEPLRHSTVFAVLETAHLESLALEKSGEGSSGMERAYIFIYDRVGKAREAAKGSYRGPNPPSASNRSSGRGTKRSRPAPNSEGGDNDAEDWQSDRSSKRSRHSSAVGSIPESPYEE